MQQAAPNLPQLWMHRDLAAANLARSLTLEEGIGMRGGGRRENRGRKKVLRRVGERVGTMARGRKEKNLSPCTSDVMTLSHIDQSGS